MVKQGTKEVKSIHLDCGVSNECCFSLENFNNLSNLEFLGLGDSSLVGNFQGELLTLKWLRWQGHNLMTNPPALHLKNLVIADLSKSEIRDDWNSWSSIKVWICHLTATIFNPIIFHGIMFLFAVGGRESRSTQPKWLQSADKDS